MGAIKKALALASAFFLRCVPQVERDEHFLSNVSFGSNVRFAREQEHVTATNGSNITVQGTTSLWQN